MAWETWRVLVVDDHPDFRETVRYVLAGDPRFEVVAEAASGEEAVTCAQQLQLDIVLMDLRLPGINGLTAAATIKSDRPEIIILMLSGDWSAAHDRRAKAAGIRARIAKQQFNLAEIYRALVTDSD
ncbi:MAG TPA: response regulator transcription factor [Anaerolineae bacterium]|nr:response regulator transcription factor [Anaerolineae bacterium]MCB9105398.1 response regulator transcription factor [Anaerolineales bacterium]HRV90845.1 response regulator transcription factor [Anaerolineae bacterium]